MSVCCKDNPKKFWKYINRSRTTVSDIGELIQVDDYGKISVANTDKLKAEFLRKAFRSVFSSEKDVNTCKLPDEQCSITDMEAVSIDHNVIVSKLSKLNVNKSAGPDDIYPRILFEAKDQLVCPFYILFNTSLKAKKTSG